jgi:hypothetical protein
MQERARAAGHKGPDSQMPANNTTLMLSVMQTTAAK